MERSHSRERKDKGSHFLLSSYAETNVTHVTSASSPFGDTRSGFRIGVRPFCLMHHIAALRVEDGS
ncbi:hypothetical protein KSB_56410 [Ktedonobacter robiniae]|uniref:Uncharacterized protein n=1 Tax=Ktedonobacter robiniae TaxID=2778365 RepID=A0ABQ3UWT6_9CHLR|nr:hypothetical protein KSB_56410 [Ktedonobacter robiniae]